MFVYKKLKASDASITAFEAHKSYTTGSLYLGRYNSSSKDTFSQFNLNNELEYFQLDHTFYRNAPFQLGNLNGGLNYINQEKRLYDKALIISLPQNQFGDGLQKGQVTVDGTYKDDSKGNLYKSSEIISNYPEDKERVLYVGPVKGFQRTDLTRDLKTGRLLANPPSEYSSTQVDDSLYVNSVVYDSASIEHFSDINCTAIQLSGGPVKVSNSNHYNFNNDDFTVSFYYKSANTTTKTVIDKGVEQSIVPYPNSNGYGAPVEYGSQVSTEKVISNPFKIDVSNTVTFSRTDVNGNTSTYSAGSISANTLHHIACVKTGSVLQIWVDGNKIGSDGTDNTTICRNKADVTIGRGTGTEAKASQIMVWNKGLNSTEITKVSESIDGTPYVGNVFYENGIITFTSPKYNDGFHTISTSITSLTLNATEFEDTDVTRRDIIYNTFVENLTFVNEETILPAGTRITGTNQIESSTFNSSLSVEDGATSPIEPDFESDFSTGEFRINPPASKDKETTTINPFTSSITHTYTSYSDLSPYFVPITGSEGTNPGEKGTDDDSYMALSSSPVGIRLDLGENQTVTESINILFVSNSDEIINESFDNSGESPDDTIFSINDNIYTGVTYKNLLSTDGFYLRTNTPSEFPTYPWWSGSLIQNSSTVIDDEDVQPAERFDVVNYSSIPGVTTGALYSKGTVLQAGKITILDDAGGFDSNNPLRVTIKISGSLGTGVNPTLDDSLITRIEFLINGSSTSAYTEVIDGFEILSSNGITVTQQFPPQNNPNAAVPNVNDTISVRLQFQWNGPSDSDFPAVDSEYIVHSFGITQPSEQSPYQNYLETRTTIDTKPSSIYFISCSEISPNGLNPSDAIGSDSVWAESTQNRGLNEDINGDTLGVKALLWREVPDNNVYLLETQSFYPSGAYSNVSNNNFHFKYGPTDPETPGDLVFQLIADTAENVIPDGHTLSNINDLHSGDYTTAKLPDGASMGIRDGFTTTEASASNILHLETALSDTFTSSLNFTSSVLFTDISTQLGGYGGSAASKTGSIVGFVSDDGTKIELGEQNLYFSTASFGATASLDRGNYISGSASIDISEDEFGVYFVENLTLRNKAASAGVIPLTNGEQNVKVIYKVNGVELGNKIFDTSTYGDDVNGQNLFLTASELGALSSSDNVSFEFQVVDASNDTDLSLVEKTQGFYVDQIELRRITSSNTASKVDGTAFDHEDLIDFIQFTPSNLLSEGDYPDLPFTTVTVANPSIRSNITGISDDNTELHLEGAFFVTKSMANTKTHDTGAFQAFKTSNLSEFNVAVEPGKEYNITFTGDIRTINDTEANVGAGIRIYDSFNGLLLKETFVGSGTSNLDDLNFENARFETSFPFVMELLMSGASSPLYPNGRVTGSITSAFDIAVEITAKSGSTFSQESIDAADFEATSGSALDTYDWVGEGEDGTYRLASPTTQTDTIIIDSPHTYNGISPALDTGEITINGVTRLSDGRLEVATPLFITSAAEVSGTAPAYILVPDAILAIPVNPFTIDETPSEDLIGFNFAYTNPVNSETEILTITSIDEDNNTITVNNGQGLYQVGIYNNGPGSDQPVTVTTSNISFTGGSVSFRNVHPIFENEYHCTVEEDEYNFTLNPTVRKRKAIDHGELANFATGSNFKPYVTTIGLYNDQGDLLVVGKTSQAVRMSDETDTTFVVKFDT